MVLTEDSLNGIGGNLPEISFKNIKRVTLRERSLNGIREMLLYVESIWKVTVEKEVFGSTSYNASFTDIADLKFNEGFLQTPVQVPGVLKLFINRCHINELLPIKGKTLEELRIENSDIESIKSKAFALHEIGSLVMNNVNIQSIETDIFKSNIFGVS